MNEQSTSYRTIEEIIGPEAAAKVRDAFGGERIYIPKQESRNKKREVILMIEKGYPIERIARAMSMSERSVYLYIKNIAKPITDPLNKKP